MPTTSGANFDLDSAVNTPLGQALGAAIRYVPGIAMNRGDKFTVKISGATFRDGEYFMFVDETVDGEDINADGDTADQAEAAQFISTLDAANGVTEVTFRITSDAITAGTKMIMISSNAAADTAAPMAETTNPLIRLNSSLVDGSAVSLTVVDSQDVGGTPLSGANDSTAGILINVEDQFEITFASATSVIDVNNGRTQFVEEGAANGIETSLITADDTDLDQSAGTITINNDSDNTVEDFVPNATGTLDLQLVDSSESFSGISLALSHLESDTNGDLIENAVTTSAVAAFDASGAVSVASAVIPLHAAAAETEDVIVTVDGTTVLNTRTIELQAQLTMGAGYNNYSAESTDWMTWDINGYQTKVRNFIDSSYYSSVLTVFNTSAIDAQVEADLTLNDGTAVPTITLPDIAAGVRSVVSASGLQALTAVDLSQGFTLNLTTTIPVANGDSIAWQNYRGTSNGQKLLPVIDNNAGSNAN